MNLFRYRGYYYDSEAGFYYLNSRYYDPAKGRFISADIYVNANGDLTGFNMFAYCSNNPVMCADSNGQIAEPFRKDFLMDRLEGGGGGCGGGSAGADAATMLTLATLWALIRDCIAERIDAIHPATSISIPKAEEKEKDITAPPPSSTIIYRYYATKSDNLAPRRRRDYDGLSFSTLPPRPGVNAVTTTIEAVNSTGILRAVQTSNTHILIVPVDGTVIQWMEEGQNSRWSKVLSNIVTEIQ